MKYIPFWFDSLVRMSTNYLNGMRGTAALLVLVHHNANRILTKGAVGVDMFFLLSSFLITTNVLKAMKNANPLWSWNLAKILLTYTIKRLVRIWPLYFIIVLIIHSSEWFGKAYFTTPNNFNLFRVGVLFQVKEIPSHVFVLWTIPIEMTYYAIAPFWVLLYLNLPYRWLRLSLCLGTVLLSMVNILQINYKDSRHYPQNFDMHYGPFLLGSVVAIICNYIQTERTSLINRFESLKATYEERYWILRKVVNYPKYLWYTLAWLVFFIFWEFVSQGYVPIHIIGFPVKDMEPIAPVLGIFIIMETIYPTPIGRFLECNALTYLGKISYPLYIFHPILRYYVPVNLRIADPYLSMFYLMFGSIALGSIVHHLIEAPILAPFSRKLCAYINQEKTIQLPEYGPTALPATPSKEEIENERISETNTEASSENEEVVVEMGGPIIV